MKIGQELTEIIDVDDWWNGRNGVGFLGKITKTDRSKSSHCLFGGKVLTDKKSGQNFLKSIFSPTHHVVCLCLDILAVQMDFVRKRCWSVLVDSSPTLIFGASRYVK